MSIACGAIVLKSLPAQAAIQIEYFNAVTIDDYLRLEWRTAVENDLAFIEVYCKEEDEPNSQYHLIGSRIAQGSKNAGADYAMNLYNGIEPTETYCFRLKEITTDGRKGDLLDYCGYGLNITPFDEVQIIEVTAEPTPLIVPLLTETINSSLPPTITVLITPTAAITAATPTATPTLIEDEPIIIINTPASVATATGIPNATATLTVTIAATPTATAEADTNGSPAEDDIIIVVPTEDPTAVQSDEATPAMVPTQEATLTTTPEITFTATVTPEVTMTPELTQTVISTSALASSAQVSPLSSPVASLTPPDPSDIEPSGSNEPTVAPGELETVQMGTTAAQTDFPNTEDVVGNPPYIILTATPVVTPRGIEPTFTPFPTAVLQPDENFVTAMLPTQNLMILLLCGVFSGASGLGILGLVTTLLYMRSRKNGQQGNRARR